MAERIGAVYLKRLFFLHFGRAEALKRILLPPPHPHAPTPSCDFSDQKKLTRAWALASAYLAWDTRPGPYKSVYGPCAGAHSYPRPIHERFGICFEATRRPYVLRTMQGSALRPHKEPGYTVVCCQGFCLSSYAFRHSTNAS